MLTTSLKRTILISLVIFLPTQVLGQTINLDKSQSYALDNYIRAFRAPTTDSAGTVHYYDLTIKLTVNPDGTLSPVATVSASRSPMLTTGVIVPGAYKAPDAVPPAPSPI